MTIVTRRRTVNFAVIPNAVAEDSRLSFAARGLLCYLLAKPNDWKVYVKDIQNAGGIGRDKAYALLKELRETGYVVLDVKRGQGSRIEEQRYIVYDCAVPGQLPLPENPEVGRPVPEKPEEEKPLPENPASGIAVSGKAGRINKNPGIPKNQNTKNPFDQLWAHAAAYAESRAPCEQLFVNLPADVDRRHAVELWETFRTIQVKRVKKPSLSAYLRRKEWRDLVDAPPTDRDGDFIITPDREEWQAWLEAVRDKHGEPGVASARAAKRIVRKDRWPSFGEQQLRMAGT